GSYELECTLERAAGAEGGFVISAGPEEWITVGVDAEGLLRIRSASDSEGEIEWSEWPPDDQLDPAVKASEKPRLLVRVMRESGDITIRVGDRDAIETYWSGELPESLTTGVYSFGGRVVVHDAVLRDVVEEESE
ncbi:MAG: hypothetical protein KDC14_07250, partial [Planctomycetes bacterium]|nr:hypothetical protein [Planctomycetota bacterium]